MNILPFKEDYEHFNKVFTSIKLQSCYLYVIIINYEFNIYYILSTRYKFDPYI